MKKYILILFLLIFNNLSSQEKITSVMTLSEFLGYVKAYHPTVKQASLTINNSEAKLLKARGAFDQKLKLILTKNSLKKKNIIIN